MMNSRICAVPLLMVLFACGGSKDGSTVGLVRDACIVPSPCWMTAGGTKWEPVTKLPLADHNIKITFGGNVAPSCSLDPGEGGQWNHVDHLNGWHFQAFEITEVSCSGVPTGSPDVTVNRIDFSGTGRLDPIGGNKAAPYENVCFTAAAEDWSEPGSKGQPDPLLKDRYFIRVTDCAGTTLPVELGSETALEEVTGGNVQIHPCF